MTQEVEFNGNFIRKVDTQIRKAVNDRKDKIVLQALKRITDINPVLTGQSRAGWNIGLNEIVKIIPDPPAKGSVLAPPPQRIPKKGTQYGDKYHLVNAVPHTVYLNEGSSVKAPANFVEREVLDAVKDVERGDNT